MGRTRTRFCRCAVCGKTVPVEDPMDSGYGFGKKVACTYKHQLELVRKYGSIPCDGSAHNAPRTKPSTAKVLALRQEGRSSVEIANECATTTTAVYKICERNGMPFRRKVKKCATT